MRKIRTPMGSAHDFINNYGIKAVISICKELKFTYDTIDLFSITTIIEKRYGKHVRERYGIEYIHDVIKILEHIKEKKLL